MKIYFNTHKKRKKRGGGGGGGGGGEELKRAPTLISSLWE